MFSRPVDIRYAIKTYYGEKSQKYEWSIDDNDLWIPIRGPHGYGQHRGTDFDCPSGTIVRAMCDGMVIRGRYENALDSTEGAGLYLLQLVIMPGYDSWILRYSHLQAIHVEVGSRIYRHTPIAESGATGNAQSPFLHIDLMNMRHQWRAIPLET